MDYWGHHRSIGAVFLTHAHADHLSGFDAKWEPDGRTVYCSAVTKALLLRKFPGLASRGDVQIVSLAQNTPTVVRLPDRSRGSKKDNDGKSSLLSTLLPMEKQTDRNESTDDHNHTLLTVTALDAGHCPGSYAYLFEGQCGRILHTGDFRREDWCGKGRVLGYDEGSVGKQSHNIRACLTGKQSHNIPTCLTQQPLDLLLLDNTYGDASYAFPSRVDACGIIVDLITNKYPNRDVFVGVDSLGKEQLLGQIANAIGEPVRLTPERFQAAVVAYDAAHEAMCEGEMTHGIDDETNVDNTNDSSSSFDPFLGTHPPSTFITCSATSKCRVFAVPKQRVTQVKLGKIQESTGRLCVGILPTGWAASGGSGKSEKASDVNRKQAPNKFALDVLANSPAEQQTTDDGLPPVHAVPYSLHAPYDELEVLVRRLRPRAVVGNTREPSVAGVASLDVAKHFRKYLAVDDVDVLMTTTVADKLGMPDIDAGDIGDTGDMRLPARRLLAQSGHRVSHAFNKNLSDHVPSFGSVQTKSLRLKRSVEMVVEKGKEGVLESEKKFVARVETIASVGEEITRDRMSTGTCSKERELDETHDDLEPHEEMDAPPVSKHCTRLTKTYTAAVSTLFRKFTKRRREVADTTIENETKTGADKVVKKERKHVPRWVTNVRA